MNRRTIAALALGLVPLLGSPAPGQGDASLADQWEFGFGDFAIGAWWGPDATEAEMALYKDAGFNIVMAGRYMQLDRYGDPDSALAELDLAHRYGLKVMFDTYTMNDRPWGGLAWDQYDHPTHHAASVQELAWLDERIGTHPALIGYMIGDDQGAVGERTASCTEFLWNQPPPRKIPWLCGWIPPEDLAAHRNPYCDPQIYPSLYAWDASAEEQVLGYCTAYQGYSSACKAKGVAFWPMLNTTSFELGREGKDMLGWCPSDSLVRFPAYLALAYGAQGVWYFTYNGGALQHLGPHQTTEEARAALTPLYEVVRKANVRIAAWGPRVLGANYVGLFGTAFPNGPDSWPVAQDEIAIPAHGQASPRPGKLVESMSESLIVGILVKPGATPLAMGVDARAPTALDDRGPRTVTVRFSPGVTEVAVLEDGSARAVPGSVVELTLDAGEGQLLELSGTGLDELCNEAASYGPVPGAAAEVRDRVSDAELRDLRTAKLRIDVFGSDGGQFAEKYINARGPRGPRGECSVARFHRAPFVLPGQDASRRGRARG